MPKRPLHSPRFEVAHGSTCSCKRTLTTVTVGKQHGISLRRSSVEQNSEQTLALSNRHTDLKQTY